MTVIKSLGYITVAASDMDRWRQFAFGVLGFAEGKGSDPSRCTCGWTSARPASSWPPATSTGY